jgi:hypothetical protein
MTLAIHPRTVDPERRRRCVICDSGRRDLIDPLLAAGRSAYFIEKTMARTGVPTKSETVLKHLHICLGDRRPSPEILADTIIRGRADFAAAIRDEAMKKLEQGELKVNANHGLAAQGLLDRRADKQADRDLLMNLARLMTAAPPPEVLVGEYEVLPDVVTDE